MRITIFCDEAAIARISFQRMVDAARFRFGKQADIAIATDSPAARPAQVTVISSRAGIERSAEAWVIAMARVPVYEDPQGLSALRMPGAQSDSEGKKLYILEPHGLIHLIEPAPEGGYQSRMKPSTEPYLEEHIFSRLGPRTFRNGAYMFPYGGYYEALCEAFGPVNSLGFRIAEDLVKLRDREPDRMVIAVFGGSSTMSPACLQDEMFCSRLAVMLEEDLKKRQGRFKTVSVLNFGNSGHTVINELITYLLFAQSLSPHVVIAHDAFNDFAHGLRTDPVLLAKYRITYLPEYERWAQMLLGSNAVPLTQNGPAHLPFAVRTSPQIIVRAYLERKRQFREIVERSGTRFIYGIQPAWFGKSLTETESRKMEEIRQIDKHSAPIYDGMKMLYSMARDQLLKQELPFLVDVNHEFGSLASTEEVFVDHAHLNPVGDMHVATIYHRAFIDRVLPSIE